MWLYQTVRQDIKGLKAKCDINVIKILYSSVRDEKVNFKLKMCKRTRKWPQNSGVLPEPDLPQFFRIYSPWSQQHCRHSTESILWACHKTEAKTDTSIYFYLTSKEKTQSMSRNQRSKTGYVWKKYGRKQTRNKWIQDKERVKHRKLNQVTNEAMHNWWAWSWEERKRDNNKKISSKGVQSFPRVWGGIGL